MTQPDSDAEQDKAKERLVMDYPVTLERLPDALRRDETSDETE